MLDGMWKVGMQKKMPLFGQINRLGDEVRKRNAARHLE